MNGPKSLQPTIAVDPVAVGSIPSLSALVWYQRLAGTCDLFTGLLLMIEPIGTLRWMGIAAEHYDPAMVSFVGAFVAGVGMAYFVAAPYPRRRFDMIRLDTTWLITALCRACVAAYLTWAVATGHLEPAWLSVAATDAFLAGLQLDGRRRGWLAPERIPG